MTLDLHNLRLQFDDAFDEFQETKKEIICWDFLVYR